MIRRVRPALCALLLAACAGSSAQPEPLWTRPGLEGAVRPEMGPPQPGDPAPHFQLPRTGGGQGGLPLAQGGRWAFVHFTATWCPFCDAEVEHLSRIADEYAARGVDVLLIDVGEEPEVWRPYAAEHARSASLVLLEDATGEVSASYAPARAQPSFTDRSQVMLAASVLVDPDGRIRLFVLADSQRFDPTFAALLDELDRMLGVERTRGAASTPEEPTAEPEPEALTPEQAVSLSVEAPPSVAAGSSGELVVRLRIAPDYHVMSDHPSQPNYIPTVVEPEATPGVTFGERAYPPPSTFELFDETITTFEGDVDVRVPFTVEPQAEPGARELRVRVGYQACTHGSCLFPITRIVTGALEIRAPGT